MPDKTPTSSTSPAPVSQSVYARRKLMLIIALAVGGALIYLFVIPRNGATFGFGSNNTQATEQPAIAAVVPEKDVNLASQEDMVAASNYAKSNSTLKGYVPIEAGTVRWAYLDKTGIFSRSAQDGSCYYYAVLNGNTTTVKNDPTGVACTKSEIKNATTKITQ